MEDKIKVGISVGDINGIGMEVILKTFSDALVLESCIPVIYGSSKLASFYKKTTGLNDLNFNIIRKAEDATAKKINIINVWEEEVKVEPGVSSANIGIYAFRSLEAVTHDIASNKVDVMVTAPINKHNIHSEKFPFPGHTEYLANYANADSYLMILCSDEIRIGCVTGHVAVKEVAANLSAGKILEKIIVLNRSLVQDFGIPKPKIAVLGLNPHAGDKGVIGDEESKIIIPAIEQAQSQKIYCWGPYSADGFFGSGNYNAFDGILAMYHDQGLIPFKTLSFNEGVNFTAGLPIVRTSPDHGTGYDIAGKNKASENSFRKAVWYACDIYRRKKEYKKVNANPLALSGWGKDRDS